MTGRSNGHRLLLVLLVAILGLSGCGRKGVELGSNQIGLRLPDGYMIKAEVADTAAEREQGLSGRNSLAADAGMWFVFERSGEYPFWMKGMQFGLDIIWLDDDLRIVEMVQGATPQPEVPENKLNNYVNRSPAQYVLEVPAGTATAHHLKAGNGLELISS
jgi:hypothetical protein